MNFNKKKFIILSFLGISLITLLLSSSMVLNNANKKDFSFFCKNTKNIPSYFGSAAWFESWSREGSDISRAIKFSSSGDNFYVVGYTDSCGNGKRDVLVLKYKSDHSYVNGYTWGGYLNDEAYDIAITSSNDYLYIAGYTQNSDNDSVLLKMNTNGNLEWYREWDGGNGNDYAYGVAISPDDEYIYTTGAKYTGSHYTPLIIKYDKWGNQIWNTSYPLPYTYTTSSITISPDGNFIYILGGYYYEGLYNFWFLKLWKYSSNGNLIWNKTWGDSPVNTIGTDLAISPDGNYLYLTGYISPMLYKESKILTAKFDANTGNEIWSKTSEYSNLKPRGYAIDISNDGSYIAIASKGTNAQSSPQTFAQIIIYDPNGNQKQIITSTLSSKIYDLDISPSDSSNIIATGVYTHNNADIFVLKYSDQSIPSIPINGSSIIIGILLSINIYLFNKKTQNTKKFDHFFKKFILYNRPRDVFYG
ncbi:MAG: WD40 repeat domain-containing protein [Candidatus Helarchaeota archaeon]